MKRPDKQLTLPPLSSLYEPEILLLRLRWVPTDCSLVPPLKGDV
ncbi:MAG: hypothetical protein ACLQBD_10185 [Syntrophobacteraceae bacterium]